MGMCFIEMVQDTTIVTPLLANCCNTVAASLVLHHCCNTNTTSLLQYCCRVIVATLWLHHCCNGVTPLLPQNSNFELLYHWYLKWNTQKIDIRLQEMRNPQMNGINNHHGYGFDSLRRHNRKSSISSISSSKSDSNSSG